MKFLSCNVRSLALASLVFRAAAAADCGCGYTTNVGTGGAVKEELFTEAFETDFTNVSELKSSEWRAQTYNKTSEKIPGVSYGRLYSSANTRTTKDGLELIVGSKVIDDLVPVAEVAAKRKDFFYGSYRTSVKLSSQEGTCAAFYWYFNDTQEIDMEFLTKEFDPSNNSYPINLVLHSPLKEAKNFDAQKAGTWSLAYLPFNPADGFHEYRFDFLPGLVYFYADGKYIAQMSGAGVPTVGGRLLMAHWSNGKATWSGGPPKEDSPMTVKYVKTYFNSSEPEATAAWQKRCPDVGKGKVCAVPELGKDAKAAQTFLNVTSENGGAKGGNAQGQEGASGSDSEGKKDKNAGLMVLPTWMAVLLPAAMVSALWML